MLKWRAHYNGRISYMSYRTNMITRLSTLPQRPDTQCDDDWSLRISEWKEWHNGRMARDVHWLPFPSRLIYTVYVYKTFYLNIWVFLWLISISTLSLQFLWAWRTLSLCKMWKSDSKDYRCMCVCCACVKMVCLCWCIRWRADRWPWCPCLWRSAPYIGRTQCPDC